MEIAIRTDASHAIGSGHLMRCLALASEMRKVGWKVVFVTSRRENKWIELINGKGCDYEVIDTPIDLKLKQAEYFGETAQENTTVDSNAWRKDALETRKVLKNKKYDWIVVDHYNLDAKWESMLRDCTKRILVIDDLADRKHDCNILSDSVYGRSADNYRNLVSKECKLLLGTKYALLRPEFAEWRDSALKRRRGYRGVERVLISLGGVDKSNLTGRVLKQLNDFKWYSKVEFDVIVGVGSRNQNSIATQIMKMPYKVDLNFGVSDMASRIVDADLGIGALGVSTWERFCLGLPSINIVSELNQMKTIRSLKQEAFSGVIFSHMLDKTLCPIVDNIVSNTDTYRRYVDSCSSIIDGKGVPRIINEIRLYENN